MSRVPATPVGHPLRECPACAGRRWSAPRPDGCRFRGVHYRRVLCERCGLGALDPVPASSLWPQMYANDYFDAYTVHHSACHGYVAGREIAQAAARTRLDRLAPFCSRGRLLDVGCAGGHFLGVAKARGFDAQGLEYNSAMAAFARVTYGVEVVQGDVLTAPLDGWFDCIHMEDVLEHLEDPLAALERLTGLLAPGGVLIVDGPLERQRSLYLGLLELNFMLRRVEDPEMAPWHLWQFSLEAQRRLVGRAGLVECHTWVYEEERPPLPSTGEWRADVRQNVAHRGKQLSVFLSRLPALRSLRLGERALAIYTRQT